MKDTKLISLLKTLSPEEIKSFEKFLASPFFNTVKNHITLFNELKKFYPDFDNDKLTNEYLHKKLFKGKPFNKQVMWNLISGFEKLVKEFIIQIALNKSKPLRYTLIFDELEQRHLDKLLLKEIEEMERLMSEYKIGSAYSYYLLSLEEAKISYWQKVKGLQNAFATSLFKTAELITLEFLMRLYEKIADMGFYKRTYNIDAQDSIFSEIVKVIDFKKIAEQCVKSRSANARLIEFYCNVIVCITESGLEEYYTPVRDFLMKNHKLFEIHEKRNLISICENYCQNKKRSGKTDYRKQLFELHEFRINNNILKFENGKFNKSLYLQIINNALSLDKTAWVINFIKEHTSGLTKEHQRTMRALVNAFISFKQKKYEDVLENLNKVEFIDTRDKVHVKNLMSRTLYEMKEYELLLNHIDSSKHFLKNNAQVSGVFQESYVNFYNYLHKIIMAKEKNEDLKLLIDKINMEKSLSNKRWLIEKIVE